MLFVVVVVFEVVVDKVMAKVVNGELRNLKTEYDGGGGGDVRMERLPVVGNGR